MDTASLCQLHFVDLRQDCTLADKESVVGDSEVGTTRRYSSESQGIAVHNSLAA